jgi:hypothetical protein
MNALKFFSEPNLWLYKASEEFLRKMLKPSTDFVGTFMRLLSIVIPPTQKPFMY